MRRPGQRSTATFFPTVAASKAWWNTACSLPGVVVAEGAIVRNSIILHDTVIEAGAVVDRCIIDKKSAGRQRLPICSCDDNTANKELPDWLNTGLTLVGKDAVLPDKLEVGRNVVIHSTTQAEAFAKKKKVASGSFVGEQP